MNDPIKVENGQVVNDPLQIDKSTSEETITKMRESCRLASLGKNNAMFGKLGKDSPNWKGDEGTPEQVAKRKYLREYKEKRKLLESKVNNNGK